MTVGPPHTDPGTGPGSFAAPRVSIITATYDRGNVLRTAYLSDGLR